MSRELNQQHSAIPSSKVGLKWIMSFAWRDSRGSRTKLALFVSSMVLGVAALVAINSFGDNLQATVDAESRTLLGADLSFESSKPFSDDVEAIIDSLGGRQSRRTSFSSMAYFTGSDATRLATVRGHESGFPYYGTIETDPPEASTAYLEEGGALVDGTLMVQYDVQVGDSVRIGNVTYPISGKLIQTPRESAAIMLFSPRIYVPLARIDTTLLATGSRADYEVYFRFDDNRNADAIVDDLEDRLRPERVGTDTVSEEREGWNEALTNLYRFLGLVGFVALILGSLGVASSIHVYVRQRIQTVAVLRCYGASSWQTFGVYLLQAAGMGLIGAVAGSGVGIGLQTVIPIILRDFLPVDVEFFISWSAVLLGSSIGLGVTLLFALLPLFSVRSIPPLAALRIEYAEGSSKRSLSWWVLISLVGIFVTILAVLQAPSPAFGLGYAGVLLVVFLLLAGIARLVIHLLRRRGPSNVSYVIRQGIANLYRPQNQTLMMVVSLGLGTFLVSTMLLSEQTLLGQIDFASSNEQPNLVFYDIQPYQIDQVAEIVELQEMPVIDQVPIVTMRISSVNGETVESMRADTTRQTSWAHRREYRSTYRDYLTESETLIEGEFVGVFSGDGPIPVSVERDVATQLEVEVGDTIVFNVQGVEMTTRVASLRMVDWRNMQTNFFIVFPTGPIDSAPAFHVLMTRAQDERQSAVLQSAVVRAHPNVSSIDVSVVLSVFEAIFSRIAFVVRFMALFSVITGLIVLSGSVMISRFQRMEESVLLKTLGASRKAVLQIMAVEYFTLGLISSVTGLIFSFGAGWAISRFVFDSALIIPYGSIALILITVISLTILIGLVNSRGVYERQALDVLRNET